MASDSLGAPVFIVGSPRSGTTYAVELLNRHSEVFITNELRVMTFLNRVLNRTANDNWILMNGRQAFLESLQAELPGLVERHYRRLGATRGMRWGDKNPHYADSKTDPECLDLIDRLFPDSQFINMVRDGRDVAASLVKKGWVDIPEAIDVWRRHVVHGEQFGNRVGGHRWLTVRYEELIADDVGQARRMLSFLDLREEDAMLAFAAEQAQQRSQFSKPMSDLSQIGARRAGSALSADQEREFAEGAGDLLRRYGYI